MVNNCYEYLLGMNTYTSIVREVPFLSRCIDMVIITRDNEMITIEFKIKDWRHALEQVKNHKLGADRAYICLPIKQPSSKLLNALSDEKVGLYLYTPDEPQIMREYLPAPKNKEKIDVFSSILFNKVSCVKERNIC